LKTTTSRKKKTYTLVDQNGEESPFTVTYVTRRFQYDLREFIGKPEPAQEEKPTGKVIPFRRRAA
jgi:hypothetical protein